MRKANLAFVVLLLCGCSRTVSLDGARDHFIQARTAYDDCVTRSSGEAINRCESERAVAEEAERAYKDAMSSGISTTSR